ncbi:MAG: hypothetical protein QM820_59085 [Minicystis sp.]
MLFRVACLLASTALVASVLAIGCGDVSTTDPEPHDGGLDAEADAGPVTDASDGGDAEVTPHLCEESYGPVTPSDTADVVYDQWTTYRCLGDKARLCQEPPPHTLEKLLRCEAVEGGWYWGQGSASLRVVGRDQGACVIDIVSEVEGGASVHHCNLPLPMTPWKGLSTIATGGETENPIAGVEAHCSLTVKCSLFPEGPNPCDGVMPRPPLCDDFMLTGIGDP